MLGRPGDQVAGRRHQADAGADRQCSEHGGRGEAGRVRARERRDPDHRRAGRARAHAGSPSELRGQHPPALQPDRAVGDTRREGLVVRDQDERAVARDAREGGRDLLGGGGVEVGRRLVEQQDRRVAQERPRQRDAPRLPGGEIRAAVAHPGRVPRRKVADEAVGRGACGRRRDLGVARAGAAEADRVRDRRRRQVRALGQPRHASPPQVDVHAGEVGVADAAAARSAAGRSAGAAARGSSCRRRTGRRRPRARPGRSVRSTSASAGALRPG